ncbi:quinolinate synthase NadA [Haliangium ochraceum]|uniref:Quinolinate synthase n=1 Tax=Haliangium ochraceum (strain DSM 14365 / JCM 11303 / SMP-2) TaxID=502025 RepID=D0LXF2_HALO1|nr:quinolinate synthase NadA [Haliangium ochraceum]ACY17707.1 quinolinate synthetase complex, A subunit [Haliangium ochraceum DSM 14365]
MEEKDRHLPTASTPSPATSFAGSQVRQEAFPDDLEAAIVRLKSERNAVLLAHYYQEDEVQDLADFVGDSLQLSQQAKATDAEVICFAGVHFMAETAKILNPTRKVIVPDLQAGCSLADGCPAPAFAKWLEQYPEHTVVSYINCSAEVKALSDVICTSSNAVRIVESLAGEKVVFAPDKHLGRYVAKQTGRDDLVLWQGTCVVHETFSEKKLIALKVQNPEAKIVAHPECEDGILRHADFIASTSGLIGYVAKSEAKAFIIATEAGILHKMRQVAPDKILIPAPPDDDTCSCNMCPFMRLNTLEKLYLCLRDLGPEVDVPERIRERALQPIERMLALSA